MQDIIKNSAFIFPLRIVKNKRSLLLLFHPLSGICLLYKKLVQNLHSLSIYCVNYPFNEVHSSRFMSIEDMVKYYQSALDVIIDEFEDIYLLGYSFGGYLAYEQAKILIDRDIRPKKLIIIDTIHPEHLNSCFNLDKVADRLNTIMDFNLLGINSIYLTNLVKNNYKIISRYTLNRYIYPTLFFESNKHPKESIKLWKEDLLPNCEFYKNQEADHYEIIESSHVKKIADILQNKIGF